MRCTPIASESVTVGSSPSGTNATIMPIANMKLSAKSVPANNTAAIKNRIPILTAIAVTTLVMRRISFCSGLSSSLSDCVSSAILPELRIHAGRVDQRGAGSRRDVCPGEYQVREFRAAQIVPVNFSSCLVNRMGFSRERRLVDPKIVILHQPRIRRDPVALGEQYQITRHQFLRRNALFLAVAHDARIGRQKLLERGSGLLRSEFLEKAEQPR